MRWHVHAEGDAPAGEHRDLADRLGKLLQQPRFGTDASNFSGIEIEGPVHQAPDVHQAPAAEGKDA